MEPNGRILPFIEHKCTSTVIWPENSLFQPCNSLIVDPCFSENGMRRAIKRLDRLGTSFERIGGIFVTHKHRDHWPKYPSNYLMPKRFSSPCSENDLQEDIRCIPCPGHSSDLIALAFDTKEGNCWIVGDAIINKSWLTEWAYYWPNGYTVEQIVQTWNSVAHILCHADIIVPGHGFPFRVTVELIENMIRNWHKAQHSNFCPNMKPSLYQRLDTLMKTE